MVPEAYITVEQAMRQCERMASWHREVDEVEGSPFRGANMKQPSNVVLERALAAGKLLAAVIRANDGELVAMPPASWRRGYQRPVDEPRSTVGIEVAVPVQPFAEAAAGRDVPAMTDPAGNPDCWGKPIIAEHDLTKWWGDTEPAAEPHLRPAKWPATASPSATLANAIKWMRTAGSNVRKASVPDCMKALGCSREVAREAVNVVFGPAGMGRPRK